MQDSQRDVANLEWIKESLKDSKRVMKHIAAIVHGNEFMIISPLANLRDLEIFLRGGYEPNPGTDDLREIYDFDLKFPLLDEPARLKYAVVKEAAQLASALKWLHEDLMVSGSSDRYLAHMDLKPANVLLIDDPGCPAGKWMLSDFAVSSFQKETNARAPDTPSIHDIGLRLTSRNSQGRISRGHGPYQPPEVDLEHVDGRKYDVWSFSCVLCDILAFAIGNTQNVYSLRNAIYDGRDDYFYRTTTPTSNGVKMIDNSNTELKSQIVEWWERLENSAASWVVDYINILRKALKPKPSERPDIHEIVNGLTKLPPAVVSQEFLSPAPGSEVLFSRHQASTLASHSEESQLHHESENFRKWVPPGGNHDDPSSKPLSLRLPTRQEPGLLARREEAMVVFRERSQISIPLPKKDTVRAVAISLSPLQVAVLSKHSVHLYSNIDEQEITRRIHLSPQVDWKKIRLASQCFAVYGLKFAMHEKQVSCDHNVSLCVKTLIAKD